MRGRGRGVSGGRFRGGGGRGRGRGRGFIARGGRGRGGGIERVPKASDHELTSANDAPIQDMTEQVASIQLEDSASHPTAAETSADVGVVDVKGKDDNDKKKQHGPDDIKMKRPNNRFQNRNKNKNKKSSESVSSQKTDVKEAVNEVSNETETIIAKETVVDDSGDKSNVQSHDVTETHTMQVVQQKEEEGVPDNVGKDQNRERQQRNKGRKSKSKLKENVVDKMQDSSSSKERGEQNDVGTVNVSVSPNDETKNETKKTTNRNQSKSKKKNNKEAKVSPSSTDQGQGQQQQQQEEQKEKDETANKKTNDAITKDKKPKEKKSKTKNKKNQTEKTQISSTMPSIPPNQPQTTNDINYKKGEKITVLHVAEKPSIAQSIANGLCKGKYETLSKGLPIHQFSSPAFPKAPNASKCVHKVTSVAGHVYNVDFPSSYQSWDSVDPADLFHAPIVKKPCKSSIVKHLSDSAKGVDFIVLWLDCDREGENIAFEVLDCCLDRMEGSSPYDRVYRAYFSAINPTDIQKAYASLGKPDRNQSLAVDARQELDLKVGVAFSRFQTRYFQGRYGDLDSAVLSYGPCQTPTLGFCVKRHVDIETFKPEPYWIMDLGLYKRGRVFKAQSEAGRSFNQQKIQKWIKSVFEASPPATAVIKSVVSKEKKQGRPLPLNTVSLLKACSKALGIGPQSAMQTAERLYLSGYLSYPRTESTAYPKSFDVRGVLQMQAGDSRWGSYVSDLLKSGNCKSRGGVDMGDHPPITPCKATAPHELSGDMARVFELVTRHFIASVSQDAVWKNTKVSIGVNVLEDKGNFTIRGKQMVSPGFLAVLLHKEYGDEKDEGMEYSVEDETEEIENLPEFSVGEEFSLVDAKVASQSKVSTVPTGARATLGIKEKMTTPPSHLSESELINLMEKNGIGTDASIATHIDNICKRNYVELVTGRKLVPTKLGLVLAQGYHLIDNSLVLPQVRADIEKECNKVAKGLANKESVLKHAIDIFSTKFHNFVKDIDKMDILFSSSFAKLQDIGKPFTRCGLSRRYLTYISGPPPRLYNKFTETVYPLPIGGTVKEWSGRNCPVEGCNFELCTYAVGQPERTFPLCPNCYNNPKPEWGIIPGETKSAADDPIDRDDEKKEREARSLAGRKFILECPHPDGHPLIEELTVADDPESEGVLTLDTHFGPKWRLVSTRAPTIYYLPKSIDKLTILKKQEDGSRPIKVEYKAGESPLTDGATKQTLEFFGDEKFMETVRIYHGSERGQGSGRGRGRGRGGRSQGRGRGRGKGRKH